jgi:hypothetical protein
MKFFGQLKHLIEKIKHDVSFWTQYSQFFQKTMWFRLLVEIFAQLALNFVNSMLALLAIYFGCIEPKDTKSNLTRKWAFVKVLVL